MLEFVFRLLACWLFGMTKNWNRAIVSHGTTLCIPWMTFEPNLPPVSFSKKRRLLQRGGFAIVLIQRLYREGNQGVMFNRKAFEYTFRRLFTGRGYNSVASLLCRPCIDLRMRPNYRFTWKSLHMLFYPHSSSITYCGDTSKR